MSAPREVHEYVVAYYVRDGESYDASIYATDVEAAIRNLRERIRSTYTGDEPRRQRGIVIDSVERA